MFALTVEQIYSNMYFNRYKLIALFLFFIFVLSSTNVCFSEEIDRYISLKKYITANMFGDAYNEILRNEITRDEIDPALQKLRTDMLEETKRQMTRRVKNRSADPAVYTVLADIAFHQSDLDNALIYISKALEIKQNPMSNYVCAKILFARGKDEQAYDKMGSVLESMPDSPVVFADFQFLYSCKTYGRDAALKICKNANFLKRASSLTTNNEPKVPVSPFKNDPTKTAVAVKLPNQHEAIPDENLSTDADLGDAGLPDDPLGDDFPDDIGTQNDKLVASSVEVSSSSNFNDYDTFESEFDNAEEEADLLESLPEEKVSKSDVSVKTKDELKFDDNSFSDSSDNIFEENNIEEKEDDKQVRKDAAVLVKKAEDSFKKNDFVMAKDQFYTALRQCPDIEDKNNLKQKIDKHFEIAKKYKEAVDLFQMTEYKQAGKLFEEVYAYSSKLYPDSLYYIACILLQGENPDYEKSLVYIDDLIGSNLIDNNIKKEAQYIKLQILYRLGRDKETLELFKSIESKYPDFLKSKDGYEEFRRNLSYVKYGTLWWIITIAVVIFALAVAFFFVVDKSFFGPSDPVAELQAFYDQQNYTKLISKGQKYLSKEQPIQIRRALLEIMVRCFYNQKDYDNCRKSAKEILKDFPENDVAWSYLANTAMAIKDTSEEAIKMYENIYRSNPGRVEYLSVLAKHYIKSNIDTEEANQIIYTYFSTTPDDKSVIEALADRYVKSRTLSQEAISVLEKAVAIKDKEEYHELLARNYSKIGNFGAAVKECTSLLNKNINNMSIHVVYTSSMRKLSKIDEAIDQYKSYIELYPSNNQLKEILDGLEQDKLDSYSENSGSVSMPDLDDLTLTTPEESDFDISNFAHENSIISNNAGVPIPDFLKSDGSVTLPDNSFTTEEQVDYSISGESETNTGLNTGSSEGDFEDNDKVLPTFDDFQNTIENAKNEFSHGDKDLNTRSGEADNDGSSIGGSINLNSDLAPAERVGTSSLSDYNSFSLPDISDSSDSLSNGNESISSNLLSSLSENFESNRKEPASVKKEALTQEEAIISARSALESEKWEEVIDILGGSGGAVGNKEVGLLLIKAYLGLNEPEAALDILEDIKLDPEMLSGNIKDLLYDVAIGLEKQNKFKESLRIYDFICNSDINYKDAFDRSDRLYKQIHG